MAGADVGTAGATVSWRLRPARAGFLLIPPETGAAVPPDTEAFKACCRAGRAGDVT